MNTISGRVILKESSVGIPDLLVELYGVTPIVPANGGVPPSVSLPQGPRRFGAVLTKADGSFELDVDDTPVVSDASARNDLHIRVLAPEEPGIAPDAQVLYLRQNAGRTEQYLIRLTTAQLQTAGISVPSEVSADFEPVPNVIGRLNAIASRDTTIADGHIKAARQLVDSHRTRF